MSNIAKFTHNNGIKEININFIISPNNRMIKVCYETGYLPDYSH
jgi:hypothetical protein